jgi:hypothetical protein
MTIWKYIIGNGPISMPKGADILDVQCQDGSIALWALIDPAEPREDRTFKVIGTGWTFDNPGHYYIATVQVGSFVWHIFEETL